MKIAHVSVNAQGITLHFDEPLALPDEVEDLKQAKDRIQQLESTIVYLEGMRPHWAQGHTSDGVAAQSAYGALNTLWEMLGAKHQTEACAKLRALLEK